MDQPRGHRRKALVAMCPTPNVTIPYKPVGCGGTAPSLSLELLGPPPSAAVPVTAMPSKLRNPLYFFNSLLASPTRSSATA